MAPLGPVLEMVGKLRSTKPACCLEQKDTFRAERPKGSYCASNQGPAPLHGICQGQAHRTHRAPPRGILTCGIPQLCWQLRSLSRHLWAPTRKLLINHWGVINSQVSHIVWKVLVAWSCLTLCDPTDCRLLGSSLIGSTLKAYFFLNPHVPTVQPTGHRLCLIFNK